MNNDAVNEIQIFNVSTRQYSWLGGTKANPIANIRGGGEWFQITDDDSVYMTSSFSRTVWRYSSRLNAFLNVTFDLDQRNLLGFCCGPIGPLYVSVRAIQLLRNFRLVVRDGSRAKQLTGAINARFRMTVKKPTLLQSRAFSGSAELVGKRCWKTERRSSTRLAITFSQNPIATFFLVL